MRTKEPIPSSDNDFSPSFYVTELLIGLLISLLFDPRQLPLWVKSAIVGITSFLIPLVFYSDPYHCSNIWPISIIFDSLQIKDPQTMSLLIGFFFTIALMGYILVCYILSRFVSVKYRGDLKSHKYMIASACFGVMMFLLFIAFWSEASPFTEEEDFVHTTKRKQGKSFFGPDRIGIFRQWFRIQRQAYLDNLTKDPLLYCGTWILMSGICLLCLVGIYELRTATNDAAARKAKRKKKKERRKRTKRAIAETIADLSPRGRGTRVRKVLVVHEGTDTDEQNGGDTNDEGSITSEIIVIRDPSTGEGTGGETEGEGGATTGGETEGEGEGLTEGEPEAEASVEDKATEDEGATTGNEDSASESESESEATGSEDSDETSDPTTEAEESEDTESDSGSESDSESESQSETDTEGDSETNTESDTGSESDDEGSEGVVQKRSSKKKSTHRRTISQEGKEKEQTKKQERHTKPTTRYIEKKKTTTTTTKKKTPTSSSSSTSTRTTPKPKKPLTPRSLATAGSSLSLSLSPTKAKRKPQRGRTNSSTSTSTKTSTTTKTASGPPSPTKV